MGGLNLMSLLLNSLLVKTPNKGIGVLYCFRWNTNRGKKHQNRQKPTTISVLGDYKKILSVWKTFFKARAKRKNCQYKWVTNATQTNDKRSLKKVKWNGTKRRSEDVSLGRCEIIIFYWFWACPKGSGYPLLLIARASLWGIRYYPSRSRYCFYLGLKFFWLYSLCL